MNSFRKDFPIFSGNDVIYFDNAATTQRPVQVLDAMRQFNNSCNANPLRGLYDWSIRATEAYEDARHAAAQFIGADMDCEIVFTRNTTESLNLVAYSYGLSHVHEGDEIVISIMEHHSNILPWQMVCRQTGAKLIYMEPEKDGTLTEQEIRSKITDRTKIVSIAHVSNVLGVTNPVRKIADTAHAHGAVVVVDGAQSTPHIPVNVKELGADFYAFSGHKLCAPMGIGVLATFADVPEKFEAGTVNAMGAVGLGAAIHYLQGVGFDTIRKTEEELTARLMDGLSRIPEITVYGSSDPAKHCGIVTFNIEGCHPHDVASVLDTEHIAVRAGHHCAQPLMKWLQVNATTRASLYFYNTEEEVDRFVAAAGKVRGWLGY